LCYPRLSTVRRAYPAKEACLQENLSKKALAVNLVRNFPENMTDRETEKSPIANPHAVRLSPAESGRGCAKRVWMCARAHPSTPASVQHFQQLPPMRMRSAAAAAASSLLHVVDSSLSLVGGHASHAPSLGVDARKRERVCEDARSPPPPRPMCAYTDTEAREMALPCYCFEDSVLVYHTTQGRWVEKNVWELLPMP
jgi:hypothetical protein